MIFIDGTDAGTDNVSEYRKIYEYTDAGKLSSYDLHSDGGMVNYKRKF